MDKPDLPAYSVAIRTLGTSGDLLQRELESLKRQTLKPAKVVIYIAEGYKRPSFQVANEQYVYVKKGMVAQAAIDYTEIDTPLLLKLDDDVEFTSPTDAETIVKALCDGDYDCVSADVFHNQDMSVAQKIYAMVTNLVFPRFHGNRAFKVHDNGSFSYLNRPEKDLYPSDSAAGPCSLWRKEAILKVRIKDELWLDSLGFSYGDDQLIYLKLVKNGGNLGVLYHSGIMHNDGKSASSRYHNSHDMYRVRALGQYLVWHRAILSTKATMAGSFWARAAMCMKLCWLLPVHIIAGVRETSAKVPILFIKGTIQGIKHSHSEIYRSLPSYILK